MQIPVLIEPLPNSGYRARSGEPVACSAEGVTSDEALQNLQKLVNLRLTPGTSLIQMQVSAPENPWIKYAGMFKDDPMFEEVVEIMKANRLEAENDPNY